MGIPVDAQTRDETRWRANFWMLSPTDVNENALLVARCSVIRIAQSHALPLTDLYDLACFDVFSASSRVNQT